MVTNTTIYTRQLYVALSDDTLDVDFRNGDEVYLIDTRQRVIYDEEHSTWYPLPAGGGGGGSDIPPWITSHETVTVGANTVAKTADVAQYFSQYGPYAFVLLKSAPNTYNQIVAVIGGTRISPFASACFRYRDATFSVVGIGSSYDATLVEGTQYEIYHI